MYSRPTIKEIQVIYRQNVKGRQFFCPKQKNKGKAGLLLEGLLGIPQSSACLDCDDGELKAFPQTKASARSRLAKQYNIPEGEYVAKETVAITMMKPSELPSTPFEASRLYKKISNVLFTPYVRDGDHIEWHDDIIFNKQHELFQDIATDYQTIQKYYQENGCTKGKIGKYLQVRTKGQGNGAPITHAFYFRRQFLIELFL
tara:strand:- start:3205 stop:3807 length:603 start_codon:yes stop_codon:yes gene_type:complete